MSATGHLVVTLEASEQFQITALRKRHPRVTDEGVVVDDAGEPWVETLLEPPIAPIYTLVPGSLLRVKSRGHGEVPNALFHVCKKTSKPGVCRGGGGDVDVKEDGEKDAGGRHIRFGDVVEFAYTDILKRRRCLGVPQELIAWKWWEKKK